MTGPSTFRDALQVSPERIARLEDTELTALVRELLFAQAYRCGAQTSAIVVNTEEKASDGGCDAWSPKPATDDDWLGRSVTCWQLKSGRAGEPARLKGEIKGKIVQETLKEGGRFVLVTSASTGGKSGEDARLAELVNEAQTLGLPTDKIEVIGSERLTAWCNMHPAVAARWAGSPDALWTLGAWASSEVHRVTWESNPQLDEVLKARRADLDFGAQTLFHLHVQGPPGVGKTRFALELCRGASWASAVIYVRQAADLRLLELVDAAAVDEGVRLVVVADEVQAEQLRPLRDSVGRGAGRIRLVTIGHCRTPDPALIPSLAIGPIEPQHLERVVSGWHPSMPREHVEFVARFADGFVRLALLAANEIARNPGTDVRGLLDLAHIRDFLDGMLGKEERSALYVVAVLRVVGWTGDVQSQGETVAKHFGLDWTQVRASVERFDRVFGIAPRGGRYRYISPVPLGIYLAVEAFSTFPDEFKTLPDALPSEEAKEAFYDRLEEIASNPQAKKFARDQLDFFFSAGDFVDPRAAKRWSALSAADGSLATRKIATALFAATLEERAAIAGSARREIVWALVRLAWARSSFRDAVRALAFLAEAENESWANNASAEFATRYQVGLGGTALPYVERLVVLDELLSLERPAIDRLVITALARVGGHGGDTRSHPNLGGLPEPEWHPRSEAEAETCVREALRRLTSLASTHRLGLEVDLVRASQTLVMLLREDGARQLMNAFLIAVRDAYPGSREALRRVVADLIYRERKYWKDLPEQALAELDGLHGQLEETSLEARLRQHVGPSAWEPDEERDLDGLAAELVSDRGTLEREWPWLTSGEAGQGWRLGEALAHADDKGHLDQILPSFGNRGRDLRVLAGYASARRKASGDPWFDEWIAQALAAQPRDVALLFELSWRCGATPRTAALISEKLRETRIEPQIANLLGNGRWGVDLSSDSLRDVLRALIDCGHLEGAASILEHRLKTKPDELSAWAPIGMELVTAGSLIRATQMANYHWKLLAELYLKDHVKETAEAIFRQQADKTRETWFAEHSEAGAVLHDCVAADSGAVWKALAPFLETPGDAYRFAVGFPTGLLSQLPSDAVADWVREDPETRASVIARLVSKDLAADDALGARILGDFGDNERVAGAFFSGFVSGAWNGPASSNWMRLAQQLEAIAQRTALPKLRIWAQDASRNLREMAERDLEREAEEAVRRK